MIGETGAATGLRVKAELDTRRYTGAAADSACAREAAPPPVYRRSMPAAPGNSLSSVCGMQAEGGLTATGVQGEHEVAMSGTFVEAPDPRRERRGIDEQREAESITVRAARSSGTAGARERLVSGA